MTDSDKRPLIVTNSQIGVIGDHATIYGGIHFYQHLTPQRVDEATLAAARARLAALPVERFPDTGALPPGSQMGFRRNPLFVGREADLLRLAATLKGGGVAAIGQIAAATGLGGIGKTQLAVEFAHRYGQFFTGGVFWLSFADPQGVPAEIATCGGPGALDLRPDFGTLPLEDQVRLVLSAWCGPLPRLLIFDNCEDEDLLARWLPPGGAARVLVTSRRGQWNAELGVTALRLDVLSRAESVALLRKHRLDLSDADADAIAEELGDLPLALHVAGRFLATYRHAAFGAPQAYLSDLRQEGLKHSSLSDERENYVTAHELHVARTFALSYEKLNLEDPTDAVALDLLKLSAYFAPGEPIPHALLMAAVDLSNGDSETKCRFEDGLARLASLGLVQMGIGGELTLHRLLVIFVLQIATSEKSQTVVERTVLQEAVNQNKTGYPGPLLTWQPHLRFVTNRALERRDLQSAKLCDELGYHLYMLGAYPQVKNYFEQALLIRENILGSEHPDTAKSLTSLGYLMKAMGDLGKGRDYLERAVAIFEKNPDQNKADIAISLNILGALMRTAGNRTDARSYLEKALSIREESLGIEHPETAQSLNTLGYLLKGMGNLEEAQTCLTRALVIRENTLGPDHPEVARSLSVLGSLLRAKGDLTEARLYLERALSIREKSLGHDHPETASSQNNLGMLLHAMGDIAGAFQCYEQALHIREKALGPEHPATATSLNNLGMLLKASGKLILARPYLERALAIREKIYGVNHPATALSLNNLGSLLRDLGDLETAKVYLEKTLVVRTNTLGSEHPSVASSLGNLGSLLRAMGDLKKARDYYEQALAIRIRVLGTNHPSAAQSFFDLSILLQLIGDLSASQTYCKRALSIWEAKLGPNHPNTQTARQSLAAIERRLQAHNSDSVTGD